MIPGKRWFNFLAFPIYLADTVAAVSQTPVPAVAGYTGVEKRAAIMALKRPLDWQIARKRGPIEASARAFVAHWHAAKTEKLESRLCSALP